MSEQFKNRCNELDAMGLKFDFNRNDDGGNYIYHGGINFHWTDITCMDDVQWNETVDKIKAVKERIDKELLEKLEKTKANNTLPLLDDVDDENKPKNFDCDRFGISYRYKGKEIQITPDGKVWINKLEVIGVELNYQACLELAENFVIVARAEDAQGVIEYPDSFEFYGKP
jgi:hypothetical protein